MRNPERELWAEVLLLAVEDALHGVPSINGTPRDQRISRTKSARSYFSSPTSDFPAVCHLAGVDPDAVRDRLKPMIQSAPIPEELIGKPRPTKQPRPSDTITINGATKTFEGWAKHIGITTAALKDRLRKGWPLGEALTMPSARRPKGRGVVSDFAGQVGTGDGACAYHPSKINFAKDAA